MARVSLGNNVIISTKIKIKMIISFVVGNGSDTQHPTIRQSGLLGKKPL